MTMSRISSILVVAILVTVFAFVSIAQALPVLDGGGGGPWPDGGFQPGQDGGFQPGRIEIPNPLACRDFGCVLVEITKFLYLISFPILTIVILWAAFMLLTAAGNENQLKQAIKALKYAGIGFVILLIAGGIPFILREILGG